MRLFGQHHNRYPPRHQDRQHVEAETEPTGSVELLLNRQLLNQVQQLGHHTVVEGEIDPLAIPDRWRARTDNWHLTGWVEVVAVHRVDDRQIDQARLWHQALAPLCGNLSRIAQVGGLIVVLPGRHDEQEDQAMQEGEGHHPTDDLPRWPKARQFACSEVIHVGSPTPARGLHPVR